MLASGIYVHCVDFEAVALLQIVIARIDRFYVQLIAARAEACKVEAGVELIKIGGLAVGIKALAAIKISIEIADIGIQPDEQAVGLGSAAYIEVAAAQMTVGCAHVRKTDRSHDAAYAAVLRRCVTENGIVARPLTALDHVVYAVAFNCIDRCFIRALDYGDMFGKAVTDAVCVQTVYKQQIACLRSISSVPPKSALFEPSDAGRAACEGRDNIAGYAGITRAPADEHCAPRLVRQAVPRTVFRAVLTLFAIAELRFGHSHEVFALAALPVCESRCRKESEQHYRGEKNAQNFLFHLFFSHLPVLKKTAQAAVFIYLSCSYGTGRSRPVRALPEHSG